MINIENNKICPNCGTNNLNTALFCSSCGTQLSQNNEIQNVNLNSVSDNQSNSDDATAKKLGIISLVLYFGSSTVLSLLVTMLPETSRNYFSSLSSLGPLIGIVVMIYGRIKYPNNQFLKTVMWIIVGFIALGILVWIIFVIWCYYTCTHTNLGGCG